MSTQIQAQHFTKALYALLDETFDHVNGYFLDQGTSMFETLATISAEEASLPVGGKCAPLAAQVKHVAFYFDVVDKTVRDPSYPPVDWDEIWRTAGSVTPDEWNMIQAELRASYDRILSLIKDTSVWDEDQIGGAIAVLAHSAYHLGEIRQALCCVKQ